MESRPLPRTCPLPLFVPLLLCPTNHLNGRDHKIGNPWFGGQLCMHHPSSCKNCGILFPPFKPSSSFCLDIFGFHNNACIDSSSGISLHARLSICMCMTAGLHESNNFRQRPSDHHIQRLMRLQTCCIYHTRSSFSRAPYSSSFHFIASIHANASWVIKIKRGDVYGSIVYDCFNNYWYTYYNWTQLLLKACMHLYIWCIREMHHVHCWMGISPCAVAK